MSLEQGFLDAVIETPDDDTPRLVYADWLDRRGDPRAEFIRVQIDLERLPLDHSRRDTLERRERELLDKHAREWAEPLHPLVREWVFRRGFIERVGMSLEVPASFIAELLRLAPIRHIRDTGQFCELDGMVEALPYLRRLTGLEFWGLYGVDNEKVKQLLQSPHLAGLDTLILHHDRNGSFIDDDVLIRWLLPQPDVQTYLPGMEPPPRMPALRELAVNVDGSSRGPSAAVVRAMARSPLLSELRKLDLSHSRLDIETVEDLGGSPYLSKLEELDLGHCVFFAEVWDAILRLPQLHQLKWLRLHGARQTDSPGDCMERLSKITGYRDAFEAAVEKVDWDTEFIHPLIAGCWTGFTWERRKRENLPGLNDFEETLIGLVRDGTWTAISQLKQMVPQAERVGGPNLRDITHTLDLLSQGAKKPTTAAPHDAPGTDVIGRLWSIAKCARSGPARRSAPSEFDPLIEEWVGLKHPSAESRERSTVRRDLVLLELACERSEDPSQRGRWERSHLLDLDDGTVYQAVTLHPPKGVPQGGVLHGFAAPFTVTEACVAPRPINPLIRWDKDAARTMPLSGKVLAIAHERASSTFEPTLAPFRRQLEHPSAPRHAVVLIRPQRIARVGGRVVLEDVQGHRLVATDLHVGDRNVANLVRAAGTLPAPALLIRLHARPIPYGVVAQPLAALTPEHHVRLGL
jgi:uncharacterized protein (TIGR02996 family)